ncbi:MAG: single-stranded-DNA-specific exonuclease RecJ [Bacteroidales bacterium]|jgi:single-stranded-DNA-specific exonuclease|nr:single-stranded-DNA-specific exonuclease RecJ [Bacteroidales bacterium]
MKKRWVQKDVENNDAIEELSKSLNIDKVLSCLLVNRDVKTFEEAKAFFRPQLSNLHDPFLMKDMPEAVERIDSAIKNNEKILVYGDYDVDGTTSVALVYNFLKNIYSNIGYYIPDRYSEGYGISYKGIDFAKEENYSLIIALDCGIKANNTVNYANTLNVDFVICDHHYPNDEIPNAVAVLDPKRIDCDYPFDGLSGCGVGFKLIQAYAKYKNIPFDDIIEYLDLVSVSIASDIVPIIDENRILAHYGLIQLNKHPRVGLKSIINISGLKNKKITIEDIVFKLGPRINATGRIESADKAVELLISQKENTANSIAKKIDYTNNTRKNIDRSITQEAIKMVDNEFDLSKKKSIVVYHKEWHKGVVGIVASRLIESYYRPTIVLTSANGMVTGSARSVLGFDIYQAIEACNDLLENFGGHMYAAGLTMKIENISAFIKRFEEIVRERISDEQLIPQVEIEAEINFNQITSKFNRILKQFQPFGPGNMAPVFITNNVVDNGEGRIVGLRKEHLKLSLIQEDEPFKSFQAIAFQYARHYKNIQKGNAFDVCYCITENIFRGNVTLQLNIKDLRFRENDILDINEL